MFAALTMFKKTRYGDLILSSHDYESIRKAASISGKLLSTGRVAWNKGIPMSEHVKAKLLESHKNYVITDDTREKLSIAQKKRFENDNERNVILGQVNAMPA